MEPNGLMAQAQNAFDQALVLVQGWLLSPAAWSQFALLIGAYFLALIARGIATPRLRALLTPDAANRSILSKARRFLLIFLPLTLPLLAYGFTAMGESVTRSLFGSGEVIAFGKRVFLFLAARALARDIVTDTFLRVLARYILVPVAALYALGFLDNVTLALDAGRVTLGNFSFSALAIVRGLIVGSLLFWLGQWSNSQSSSYIEKQPMRPAIRQLAIKASEFAIFTVAFLILMNVMGINLSSLAIIGGAIGVGLGFGVEFWVEGIDDGKNKYASDVLFLIWNALKQHDIEIPYPHRVVEIKGPIPA
ncbi:hypothetical protein [Loktanella sp. 5RATIMAR09]|uniref:hypothetical protein n=1 Tax=Loktanella sp. 5RATIMAR09 TaxID=1225655 RepID=UPI0006EB7E0F|nr:hypothetical protein [Loktanella sp. 5RATIMAR09]